ncbi:glycerophosphodiester phosphodiesterase [Desulfitobacterium sp.]|uniref:glycerophosphodiester phosphodiesterase n=1 Tax=Desulfitobacterium sp. TaxID=49981 RepID=UPI002BE7D697|nr:glycerophosphodiester phosphodiesterase [Desulfitobacterium sp.]HVJ47948.1 glycerophosphodiester phosphodiesterase [Desulfitobacterium sp.]
MKILGHRGAAGTAPENTLFSFAKGLAYGVDGFEFDVQLSRDGAVVICHDERVDRTSDGVGWVKDFTLKELKALNFGVRFGIQAELPTFEELLELLKGKPLLLNVEIKTGLFDYPGIVDKVIQLLSTYQVLPQSIVSSFEHKTVVEVIQHFPGVQTGLLYASGLINPWDYAQRLGANHLHPHFAFVTPDLVRQSHAQGIGVNTWTVDEPWAMERVVQAGVDVVISNFPERFIR